MRAVLSGAPQFLSISRLHARVGCRSYVGVFGAHVAMVIRRLLRIAALYGRRPQVVCCSATIANPEQHFRQLVRV